jgi:amino acid transporter
MLVIAIAGIKITARTQVSMAVIEYAVLLTLSIAGLVLVLGHHHGTVPVSRGWLSPAGIGGAGSAVSGFLVAVFMFTGWDGTLYVNEEVTNRHRNPARAAIAAVIILGVIYTLCTVGLQGTVPAKALQDNSASALVYTAQAIGGPGWAKAMALALALSVIATTGTGIVLGARIVYGMASRNVLPPFLGNVSARFGTPACRPRTSRWGSWTSSATRPSATRSRSAGRACRSNCTCTPACRTSTTPSPPAPTCHAARKATATACCGACDAGRP